MDGSSCASVVDSPVLPPTLAGLAEEYHTSAVAIRQVLESSANAERVYLKRFFAWFGPPSSPAELFALIFPDSVARFLAEYASGHGAGSRCCMQNTVRLFLRFAYHAGYVGVDLSALSPSVRSPRMGKVVRAIPSGCIEALLTGIGGDSPVDLRDRAIVWLLGTYGVRGVQIRRLRLEDVDWQGERIHFPAAKRGLPVDQPLDAKAGNRLCEYLRRGRPASLHREVFLTSAEPFEPIRHPRQLSRILGKRLEQAGVELPAGVLRGAHAFRHAFASRLCGRVPFKDLADMLGHRDPSTTLLYGKVDLDALGQAALPWPGGAR